MNEDMKHADLPPAVFDPAEFDKKGEWTVNGTNNPECFQVSALTWGFNKGQAQAICDAHNASLRSAQKEIERLAEDLGLAKIKCRSFDSDHDCAHCGSPEHLGRTCPTLESSAKRILKSNTELLRVLTAKLAVAKSALEPFLKLWPLPNCQDWIEQQDRLKLPATFRTYVDAKAVLKLHAALASLNATNAEKEAK